MAADLTVVYAHVATPVGVLGVAASARGICRITLPHEPISALSAWVNRRLPGARAVPDSAPLQGVLLALEQYLSGGRPDLDAPLDLRGTPFQLSVWMALGDIAYGERCTYAQVAAAIGRPRAVRAAGAAIGANPVPILLPCHRVVGSNGKLTGYAGGLALKQRLLQLEQGRQQPAIG